MNTTNLFWPVFKNIEKEIISLSNDIHFDDKQLSIYSVKIAELLLRCVVEVEAISKAMYLSNGGTKTDGKDLFFDTDCIALLETNWLLSKKQVIVSSANFYFQSDENKILYPLHKAHKRGTSGADWARAYQAVKHNRVENLDKANLKHLIRAAAALFLLNLYYRDDVFELGKENKNNFTHSLSDIFDVKVHTWWGSSSDDYQSYFKKDYFDECTFLTKPTDDFHSKSFEYSSVSSTKLSEIIFSHPNVVKYIDENLSLGNGQYKKAEFDSFLENRDYFKCFDMSKEYGNMILQADDFATKKLNFKPKGNGQYEAVVNKNQQIYKVV